MALFIMGGSSSLLVALAYYAWLTMRGSGLLWLAPGHSGHSYVLWSWETIILPKTGKNQVGF